MPEFEVYGIKTDIWKRKWQCEWNPTTATSSICFHACRAYTKRGVLRKARRWYKNGTDIKKVRRNIIKGEK